MGFEVMIDGKQDWEGDLARMERACRGWGSGPVDIAIVYTDRTVRAVPAVSLIDTSIVGNGWTDHPSLP